MYEVYKNQECFFKIYLTKPSKGSTKVLVPLKIIVQFTFLILNAL